MRIDRVTPERFAELVPQGVSHAYNTVAFSQLNAPKAEALHYLTFTSGHLRAAIVLGERGGKLLSPFSAPFGGFIFPAPLRIEAVDEVVGLLSRYGRDLGMPVEIFLPPPFYDPVMLPKVESSLLRHGTHLFSELSYHYDLTDPRTPVERMGLKALQKYKASLRTPFRIEQLPSDDPSQIARAYEVIAANHAAKGYPLRMSLADVVATAPLMQADFFLLTLDGAPVAAAQLHHVSSSPSIVQLINWGDAPGYSHLRPMNAFSAALFTHYATNTPVSIFDLGPASEGGIPATGLCDFKEGIGAMPSLKPRFRLE